MTKRKDLLASVSDVSTESEFFSPIPKEYKPGKTRYVVVVGTVMSGLGKGIFSSCLAKLMQDKGLKVAPIKLEGYLNIDSGTLNPFRHGEVFVLDDGMECDMDLGTYERMLDQQLSGANFCTSGQIFSSVLNKERHGDYLGRDVQMIPHVTGEVKLKIRGLAARTDADIVFVEIGGTVGDLENAFYIEAMRELAYEDAPAALVSWRLLTYLSRRPSASRSQKPPSSESEILCRPEFSRILSPAGHTPRSLRRPVRKSVFTATSHSGESSVCTIAPAYTRYHLCCGKAGWILKY